MTPAPTKYHAAEIAWAEAFGRASVVGARIASENARAVKVSEAWAGLANDPAPRTPRSKTIRKDAQLARRRGEYAKENA